MNVLGAFEREVWRRVCRHGFGTGNDLDEIRRLVGGSRNTNRALLSLERKGYVRVLQDGDIFSRRWQRTDKPLPPVAVHRASGGEGLGRSQTVVLAEIDPASRGGGVTVTEIKERCPDVRHLARVLKSLRKRKLIRCSHFGRKPKWKRTA